MSPKHAVLVVCGCCNKLPQMWLKTTTEIYSFTVQFSYSVVSNSLQPHGLQHTRLPCPSPSSGVCSNSCPLSQWCHPTISSSVIAVFLLPSIFPSIKVFSSSESALCIFASGCQSIGASASVLPINIQGWFPLGLIGLISLQSKGLSYGIENNIQYLG